MMSGINKASRLRTLKAVTALAALTFSGAAVANEIRFANPQSDANAVSIGIANYIETLNANGNLNLRRYGAALLSQGEVAPGLRDGVVGMGFVVSAYLPAEFSEMNLMANLSMLVTSGTPTNTPPAVASGAMMEYVLFNCPNCLTQFASQNMVFLSSGSTNPYDLLCRGSVTTLSEMRGRKFRSGAANFGRWAESVGATTVSMDSTEVFDAMSQGVLDCNMLSLGDIISNGLIDIVDTALLGVPGGVFSGFATNTANLDTWRGLSVEQRAALINASAGLVADIVIAQHENLATAKAAAIENGIKVLEIDDETRGATSAFVEGDMAVIINQFTNQYGVADAEAKVALASDLIERWKSLTVGIETDREALEALFQREIFSRLDAATHGLN
jgi:TRAP-type C4-dicarboxylate transport system substrate-binding protein